ncbi:MAG: glutathione peroxidase [Alphaproteobacteria bacterium]|nr:glutathione peroxidase [Alphaproteobacteria bacterium]
MPAMKRLLAALLIISAAGTAGAAAPTALDWRAVPLPALDGGDLPPALFEGKVVLLVNTASFCGYTHQYGGLRDIWQRYRDRGLVVLGVPSNDFGAQEPGSSGEIKQFCELTYGIDFPMLDKQRVKGAKRHPLYEWAAGETGPAGEPRWNFHKILIDRDGRLAGWFPTATEPTAPAVIAVIEAALGAD